MNEGTTELVAEFQRFQNQIFAQIASLEAKLKILTYHLASCALNAETIATYKRMHSAKRQTRAPVCTKVGVSSVKFDSTEQELNYLREENSILVQKCQLLERRASAKAPAYPYGSEHADEMTRFFQEKSLPGAWGERLEKSLMYQQLAGESACELAQRSIESSASATQKVSERNKALADENRSLHDFIAKLQGRLCEMQLRLDRLEEDGAPDRFEGAEAE